MATVVSIISQPLETPSVPSLRRNQQFELWKSDGTASGTVMVKDIYSGSGSGGPSVSQPWAIPSTSERATETNGTELWKSDPDFPQAR